MSKQNSAKNGALDQRFVKNGYPEQAAFFHSPKRSTRTEQQSFIEAWGGTSKNFTRSKPLIGDVNDAMICS